MKAAGHIREAQEKKRSDGKVVCVENAGMEGERIYDNLESIPEDLGYLSMLILKE